MNGSTRIVLLALVLGLAIATHAVGGEPRTESAAPKAFPESWVGAYRGDLVIAAANGTSQTVQAEMRIEATDAPGRFAWRLRYGTQPWRSYELVVEDATKGRYVLDEKNSILIPAVLLGDELISAFAVMKNRITARYRKVGDTIQLDMLSTTAEPTNTTGGEGRVPAVDVFRVQNRQRANLRLVKAASTDD